MADVADEIKRFRKAYPEIEIDDASLTVMAPFPSLHANDFIVYCERKGVAEPVLRFFKDMNTEMVRVYGNWQKAQRDGNAGKLMRDILYAAKMGPGEPSPEYAMISKFLMDYAKANNLHIDETEVNSWEAEFASLQSDSDAMGGNADAAAAVAIQAHKDSPVSQMFEPPPLMPETEQKPAEEAT